MLTSRLLQLRLIFAQDTALLYNRKWSTHVTGY